MLLKISGEGLDYIGGFLLVYNFHDFKYSRYCITAAAIARNIKAGVDRIGILLHISIAPYNKWLVGWRSKFNPPIAITIIGRFQF